jgi:Mn2+/Fe2+ NRAMP family transporter
MRDWSRIFAGIVPEFSTPPLMVLIMVMTKQRKIMGDRTNRPVINILGWGTNNSGDLAASIGLIASYLVL